MSILRSIGNRLRRDENENLDGSQDTRGSMGWKQAGHRGSGSGGGGGGNGGHHAHGLIGGRFGGQRHGGVGDDMPDLYYEDRELGDTVRALEEVRQMLHDVASAANEHKDMLCAAAGTQRGMGELLTEAVESRELAQSRPSDAHSQFGATMDDYADLDSGLRHSPGDEENANETTIAKFLSLEAIAAQKCLGQSFVTHSGSMIKLAIALCNPIDELYSSFEERYSRKILPLRRRYMDQKGQYLKYKRYSDSAEDDEKRSYYDALAQAAKPVWIRTSRELRTEAHVMTEVTSRNMAKWSKGLALQHERSLAIAASNFAEAFSRAKGK